jgi:uncharacterized phage protein (TIGR02218 family)
VKTVDPQLQSHLDGSATTLATLWRVERKDGTILGFTDHDQDISADDGAGLRTFIAAGGFMPSAIQTTRALNVDNLDVLGFFDSEYIDEADLLAGRFDDARVFISRVNWQSPGDGVVRLRSGILGQVTLEDGQWTSEMRGLTQSLQQQIGDTYMSSCNAQLGDGQCKVDLGPLTETGTVASVTDQYTFTVSGLSAQSDGYWAQGLVTFTSGAANGLKIECKTWVESSGTLTLLFPVAFELQAGDTFTVYPGCDKLLATCKNKFNNVLNFRGFPHVPTDDQVKKVPDVK